MHNFMGRAQVTDWPKRRLGAPLLPCHVVALLLGDVYDQFFARHAQCLLTMPPASLTCWTPPFLPILMLSIRSWKLCRLDDAAKRVMLMALHSGINTGVPPPGPESTPRPDGSSWSSATGLALSSTSAPSATQHPSSRSLQFASALASLQPMGTLSKSERSNSTYAPLG